MSDSAASVVMDTDAAVTLVMDATDAAQTIVMDRTDAAQSLNLDGFSAGTATRLPIRPMMIRLFSGA